jgi:hypothetical protein
LIYFSDEHFLEQHSIPLKLPIKLFVRVKERIKPDQSSHRVTPAFIEITLVKDYASGISWTRLEPNEYSEDRPLIPTLPPSTLPLPMTNTNSIINNNRGKIEVNGLEVHVLRFFTSLSSNSITSTSIHGSSVR